MPVLVASLQIRPSRECLSAAGLQSISAIHVYDAAPVCTSHLVFC